MNKTRIDLVPDIAKCSGCGACAAVCPKKAIRLMEADNGVKYPVIDHAACIRCGRCISICDYREGTGGRLPRAAYAAAGKCSDLVRKSASGGIFASLAMSWLRAGGMVAGAVMDCAEDVQVYHILSDRIEDVQRMQGSKYVQSDAWRCYADVASALKDGKQVLFSGTPCQVAAIRRLTGDPDNLTTIDLICHGVPPLKMLDEYVTLLGKRFHGKVTHFSFRDKSVGKSYCARLNVQYGRREKRFYLRSNELSYYKYFLESALCRENCYTCPYAKLERIADLTIGDYWGIEKRHAQDIRTGAMPQRDDWSCKLVNTEKGEKLISLHADQIELYPSQAAWVAEDNHQLRHPTVKPEKRERLLSLYADGSYAAVEAAFIRASGGKLRYHLRLLKQLYRNQKAQRKNEGHKS